MPDLKALSEYKSNMSDFAQGMSIAEKGLASLGDSQRLADIFIKKEVAHKMKSFFSLKTVIGATSPLLMIHLIEDFFDVSTNKKYLNVFLKSSYASFTGKLALVALIISST
jgi:hypothetical protein